MKTIKELAREALAVQNACNLVGVAQSFAIAMVNLSRHCNGTTERNMHPIAILWIDKMNSLAGIQTFADEWTNKKTAAAFDFCNAAIKEELSCPSEN